jgi:hypothetical protein
MTRREIVAATMSLLADIRDSNTILNKEQKSYLMLITETSKEILDCKDNNECQKLVDKWTEYLFKFSGKDKVIEDIRLKSN